ncbi:FUSC family protein [Providencia vermicola]|uniref:FUSC family protein n=1 Tax=Providencia vermicola TaxID=333965 RepID=UPI0034DD8079
MTKLSESLYLTFCIVLSFIITYYIAGIDATLWSSLSALHGYTIFNKANRYKNIIYSLLCSLFVFVGTSLGYSLGFSYLFFIVLFLSPFFYYQLYNVDSSLEMSFKYFMIFFIIGATLNKSSFNGLVIGLLIGTVVTLAFCYAVSKRKTITIHQIKKYIFLKRDRVTVPLVGQSLIYSTGLIFCVLSSRAINIDHFFWAPLTFIFVLNPKLTNIVKLTRDRVIGTLIVVLILYLAFNSSILMPYIGFTLILLFTFLIPISNTKKNNVFGTICLTGLVLSLIEMSIYLNNVDYHLLSERIMETFIGGLFAVVCSYCIKLIMKNKSIY